MCVELGRCMVVGCSKEVASVAGDAATISVGVLLRIIAQCRHCRYVWEGCVSLGGWGRVMGGFGIF
jgi:hypothetical protein